jgi:hypothetical protein
MVQGSCFQVALYRTAWNCLWLEADSRAHDREGKSHFLASLIQDPQLHRFSITGCIAADAFRGAEGVGFGHGADAGHAGAGCILPADGCIGPFIKHGEHGCSWSLRQGGTSTVAAASAPDTRFSARVEGEPGSPPQPMDRHDHQAPRRRRAAPIRRSVTVRRSFRSWPAIAVLALVLVTAGILLFNQQHSGQSLKIRRELRKF